MARQKEEVVNVLLRYPSFASLLTDGLRARLYGTIPVE
jgi:hypothetical protein